jgi:hypothetical protein
MFPAWPNELFVFSVFWISGHDAYRRSALLIAIYSTTRNTGNIRNSAEKTQVGLGFPVEQTGNTCNASPGHDAGWMVAQAAEALAVAAEDNQGQSDRENDVAQLRAK